MNAQTSLRKYFVLCLLFAHNLCFGQFYNRVVITEIMADPAPAHGLPEVEYLELYNRSGIPVSVKDWKLDIGSRTVLLPDSILMPNSYVIICSAASSLSLKSYGSVIPLNTFSLPNDGSTLSLSTKSRQLVFSVSYLNLWWTTDTRDGGYAIEMIDTENPCVERGNWLVSKADQGGTPGRVNSVTGTIADHSFPELERAEIISSNQIRIIAGKKLDSLSAVSGSQIQVSGLHVIKRKLETPHFRSLILTTDIPFKAQEKYTIEIRNLSDCAGNLLREATLFAGLPSKADSGDVVLNEILFNPTKKGVDFFEIYNRTNKYISLKNWSVGNVRNGKPDVFKTIVTDGFILSPFTYLALSTDNAVVKELYPSDKARHLLEVSSLPSFPNTSGGIILRNESTESMDRFDYTEDMHDPLINNPEGISLEKADAFISSEIRTNWHSAAATTGYGTPGYANSQIRLQVSENIFTVTPEAFVPRSDGLDNFATIRYELIKTGRIATINLYDIHGRMVKNLIRNQLIGSAGEIHWDGTNENGNIVATGYYMILIDTFDGDGLAEQFKLKVVVVNR